MNYDPRSSNFLELELNSVLFQKELLQPWRQETLFRLSHPKLQPTKRPTVVKVINNLRCTILGRQVEQEERRLRRRCKIRVVTDITSQSCDGKSKLFHLWTMEGAEEASRYCIYRVRLTRHRIPFVPEKEMRNAK